MSATNQPKRVVTVGEPGPTQQQILAALSSPTLQSEFELVEVLEPSSDIARKVRSSTPDIVLVDHQVGPESFLDVIDEIGDQLPDVAVVAIIPSNDSVIAQQVMLAGARAFLIHPFTQVNLLSVLRRVRDLESRRGSFASVPTAGALALAQQLKTIVVYSPRGGAGCTTIATNLAISMYAQTSKRVLLMGGKLFFGHLGIMLNIRTNNTIADLIPHATQMDESLVHDVVTRHASGVYVLVDPFDLQVAQGIRPQDLYNVILGLQRMYDVVIVDAGTSLTDNAVTIMDMADRIVVVTTPDLASLHDTTRFTQITKSLAYPQEKLFYILNRTDMPGGVKTKDVLPVVNKSFFPIPDGGANVVRSINRGVPLVLRYPRNPASRAIQNLAQQFSNQLAGQTSTIPTDGMD
ncbi:MAG: AAA family ATPase [Anaerolineales bacterium]|nr:AAA family ATPase [Anaerolineales bacterium]